MKLMRALRKLLGIVEGHEEELAEEFSKRTSVSKEQAVSGLEQVQELVDDVGDDGAKGGS